MANQIMSSVTSRDLGSSRIDSVVLTRNGLNEKAAATSVAARTMPAQWGMAAIFLLLAYEWWLSGLDKVLSDSFRSDLGGIIKEMLQGNPNGWFVSLMERFVIPHAQAFAYIIETGELLVAVAFTLGAVLWVRGERVSPRTRRWLGLVVLVALIGSAFMTANYYLLSGNTWPWLNSADPFDEGLSIDGLMTLIALALIPIQIAAMRIHSTRIA
jgi:thiosulfate dehydrogenase [quinone] large subunit